MKVKVKKVYPVFAWSWDTDTKPDDVYYNNPHRNNNPIINNETYTFLHNYRNDVNDVCGICRVSYNGVCPNCKIPGKSCPLVVGNCNHNFHFHCIYRWLDTATSKGLCPMCRQEFTLKPDVIINEKHIEKFKESISRNRERRLMMENEEEELNNEIMDEEAAVRQAERVGDELDEEEEMDYEDDTDNQGSGSAMVVD